MPTISISTTTADTVDVSRSDRLDIQTGRPFTVVDVYVYPKRPANDGTRVIARDGDVDPRPIGDK